MIEAAMYIALGFCTAGLIGLAILPAFYRRASRLTEEALRAVNPSSYAEVRAAQDQVRARHAVELRRVERQLDKEREKAATHQLEGSRLKAAIDELKKTHQNQLSEMETKISSLVGDQHAVDLLSNEVKTLKQKLADAEKALAESWTRPTEETSVSVSVANKEDDSDWLPATDTMTLATITGLEAEVATLKAKLAKYEPTVASEVEASRDETARTTLAKLEAQLVDTESKYVTAQAEVTRLTLMLDAVNGASSEKDKDLSAQVQSLTSENHQRLEELRNKDRALDRLSGQIQKLQRDLEDAPALAELRKEFRGLAARLSGEQPITFANGKETSAAPASPKHSEKNEKKRAPDSLSAKANGHLLPELKDNSANGVPPVADKGQKKPSEIATAAEALVSRVVASNRKKGGTEIDSVAKTVGEDQMMAPQPEETAPKTKPSKQNKKDVA
ncbi:hypothetical protein ABLO27_21040 [Roseibium sp. SCPC15]|uniref:hypothetical protein n=1 Tax=Roseibium sp. SCP15 TaxID=3141376 RepID=UPI00333D0E33